MHHRIAMALTALVALSGALAGLGIVPWQVPAVAGVVVGLWWGFGKSILGTDSPDHRAAPTPGSAQDLERH